jgi:hypothetical protein
MWTNEKSFFQLVLICSGESLHKIGISFAPRRRPHFDVVVGLARSYDPESYASGSLLLVGSPMPERSKVMTQTKRDALAFQVGGW